MLRYRIGPNPAQAFEKSRFIEKTCSELRKKITRLDEFHRESLPFILNFLKSSGILTTTSSEDFKKISPNLSSIKQKYPEYFEFLEKFRLHKEIKTIEEFSEIDLKSETDNAHRNFFKELHINPKDFYNKITHQSLETEIKKHIPANAPSELMQQLLQLGIQRLPTYEDRMKGDINFTLSLVNLVILEKYGFKEADWAPSDSVEKLQTALKKQGPLLVQGEFGNIKYENEPQIVQNLWETPIYGWRKGTKIKTNHSKVIHAVIIIGACTKGGKGGFVYFVDPKDGSDPKNPKQRKVYVVSYENFVESVYSTQGKKTTTTSYYGYAVYYPRTDLHNKISEEKS